MELYKWWIFVCLALFSPVLCVCVVVVHFNCRIVSHCVNTQFISLLLYCWGISVVSSLGLLLQPPTIFKIVTEKDARKKAVLYSSWESGAAARGNMGEAQTDKVSVVTGPGQEAPPATQGHVEDTGVVRRQALRECFCHSLYGGFTKM